MDFEILQKIYPPVYHFTFSPQKLRKLIASAKAKNVRVVFVVMPVSAAAKSREPDYEQLMKNQVDAFINTHGVEVWTPDYLWPHEYFLDHAHLNKQGRTRFTTALKDYLSDESP